VGLFGLLTTVWMRFGHHNPQHGSSRAVVQVRVVSVELETIPDRPNPYIRLSSSSCNVGDLVASAARAWMFGVPILKAAGRAMNVAAFSVEGRRVQLLR
jgi:hypothetical protein